MTDRRERWPEWLKMLYIENSAGDPIPIERKLCSAELHTVCREAGCPNLGRCFGQGRATFLILGNICTRNCAFCGISKGRPLPPEQDEPDRVAGAVKELGVRYAVITSVTRDDLPDGGAGIYALAGMKIKTAVPGIKTEFLIPDMMGNEEALRSVLEGRADVLNHNIETVPSLYSRIRPEASFSTSLAVLKFFAGMGVRTKTGIMVGLGETRDELNDAIDEAADTGISMLTVGQYLSPSRRHYPVQRYYELEEYEQIRGFAMSKGIKCVVAGPFVRSSFNAEETAKEIIGG